MTAAEALEITVTAIPEQEAKRREAEERNRLTVENNTIHHLDNVLRQVATYAKGGQRKVVVNVPGFYAERITPKLTAMGYSVGTGKITTQGTDLNISW